MGAGKSSLVRRFVKGQFFDYQESTIGAAFSTKTLPEHNVKFEIWDTAGQERYHSLAPMYYRGAAAAIIVYDISSTESFERAKSWVKELQRQGNPNMVMALAGNKADLAETSRKVSVEDAQQYAEENGLFFMETSAKDAQNVNELFEEVARKLPKTAPTPAPTGGITLTDRAPKRTTSSCCLAFPMVLVDEEKPCCPWMFGQLVGERHSAPFAAEQGSWTCRPVFTR
eukprot:scaffold625_cov324-Pavlova_lutheri.AAC.4